MKKTKYNKGKFMLATAGLALLAAPAAMAQTTNQGVQDIVDAIDGLKPDVSTIVTGAIGLGIIVLGASIAWRVAKKFFA